MGWWACRRDERTESRDPAAITPLDEASRESQLWRAERDTLQWSHHPQVGDTHCHTLPWQSVAMSLLLPRRLAKSPDPPSQSMTDGRALNTDFIQSPNQTIFSSWSGWVSSCLMRGEDQKRRQDTGERWAFVMIFLGSETLVSLLNCNVTKVHRLDVEMIKLKECWLLHAWQIYVKVIVNYYQHDDKVTDRSNLFSLLDITLSLTTLLTQKQTT